jgi:hypothetical protein
VFLEVTVLDTVATDLTGFTVAEIFDATTIVLVAAFVVTIVTPAEEAFACFVGAASVFALALMNVVYSDEAPFKSGIY